MSALVFADSPEQGRQNINQQTIVSIPFFPEIDLTELRDVMRVDTNISSARLYYTALEAVAHVNSQIKGYRQAAIQTGITQLADTGNPDDTINGQSVKVIYYRRAVYCYAKALLLEKYADTEATGKIGERAETKQSQAEDYRREGHFAVAALIGRNRCDSELI